MKNQTCVRHQRFSNVLSLRKVQQSRDSVSPFQVKTVIIIKYRISNQLHDDEVHPNYLTPNASRRHMGVTASTSNGAGSSLAGSGQKSGLVKPQWSTPATTQLEER